MSGPKGRIVRQMLELECGTFVRPQSIKDSLEANSALAVVKMELKEALRGLSPLFTREVLLAVCMDVIAEDDDPDGPQTKLYCDHADEQMEAHLASARPIRDGVEP